MRRKSKLRVYLIVWATHGMAEEATVPWLKVAGVFTSQERAEQAAVEMSRRYARVWILPVGADANQAGR